MIKRILRLLGVGRTGTALHNQHDDRQEKIGSAPQTPVDSNQATSASDQPCPGKELQSQVEAVSECAICERTAQEVMLEIGPQDSYCQYQLTASGFGMQVVPPNLVTGVIKAIQANDIGDLHRVWSKCVPFYCPDCGVCYCRDHWKIEAPILHDEWWDTSTYGACPQGHRRLMFSDP